MQSKNIINIKQKSIDIIHDKFISPASSLDQVVHHGMAFSDLIFFLVSFWVDWRVYPLSGFLWVLLVLLSLFIHSAISLYFWLPYFSQKSFGFFGIRLLAYFYVMPSKLLIEFFFFVVLECPVLFILYHPLSISLKSPFFRHYFQVYFLKFFFVLTFPFC